MAIEPTPPDSHWPRYSSRPFPLYRYVPGSTAHPRRHPSGHSYGAIEPTPNPLSTVQWQQSEEYRYGIDLYNFGYWWECHEVFESFWRATGRETEQGHFFQALIQLAAANLKLVQGKPRARENLLRHGIARLQNVSKSYMGVDVNLMLEALLICLERPEAQAPRISLQGL
jgi:uncharacterized protein